MKNRQEKKEGFMGVYYRSPETAQKMIFYIRALIGNREAIEAIKKDILSTREKRRTKKKKGEKKRKKH